MDKKYWYQSQLRMLQTVLREPDIVDYDADKVVDYLMQVQTNCIIVNAGGIIDFFRNKLPLARLNAFMTDEDMLGDLVKVCHREDIRVMVRVDFRGVEACRYEQQPDWFSQDEKGQPMIGHKIMHRPCYSGIYANDHAVDYITDMMKQFDLDGVWENSVGFGAGPCYCKRCREQYREETGLEIPVGINYASSGFTRYRTWKAKIADEHLRRMRVAVKQFGDDKAYCAEIFGMFHASNALQTGIDLYNAKDHFDFLVSPAFLDGCASPSRKYDDLTYAASSIRFLKSIDQEKQAVLLYGNNGTKWRYVKSPTQETRIWLWEAASVGGGYWNCLFNGQHPAATVDNRNAAIEADVFDYLKVNEKILDGQQPVVDVGIYYSKFTRDALGHDDEAKDGYGVFIKGVERVLVDHHIQYSFIPDLDFSFEKIRSLKTLIMPNAAWLSDEQIDEIKRYVREGGGLVATFETSLYDENGKQRADFGLAELFGCHYTGLRRDTSSDCYQMVRSARHPVLEHMDIEKTQMIMNEGETLLCSKDADSQATMVCSYIPQIFNQPPEFAWIPETTTEFSTITVNHFGQGRVVYFANQTDKACYTNGHEDFTNTLVNALGWVCKNIWSLETNAPDSVHVTLTRNHHHANEYVLSLVNVTSGTSRPIRQVLPVFGLTVSLNLETDDLDQFKIMKQDGPIQVEVVRVENQYKANIHVDKLQEFAAIYLKIKSGAPI